MNFEQFYPETTKVLKNNDDNKVIIGYLQQWVDNSSEALKNLKRKKGQQRAQAKAAKQGKDVVS